MVKGEWWVVGGVGVGVGVDGGNGDGVGGGGGDGGSGFRLSCGWFASRRSLLFW